MVDYVYFFKMTSIDAIKIGKTSGESIENRFMQFKTYAPFGAKIIGFFEVPEGKGHEYEKKIHKELNHLRLKGEWFDISDIKALEIIDDYDNNKELKSLFSRWTSVMNIYDINIIKEKLNKDLEYYKPKPEENNNIRLIKKYISKESPVEFKTSTEIMEYIEKKEDIKLYHRTFGQSLKILGFKKIYLNKHRQHGYYVHLK
jgi:hypothetical protein